MISYFINISCIKSINNYEISIEAIYKNELDYNMNFYPNNLAHRMESKGDIIINGSLCFINSIYVSSGEIRGYPAKMAKIPSKDLYTKKLIFNLKDVQCDDTINKDLPIDISVCLDSHWVEWSSLTEGIVNMQENYIERACSTLVCGELEQNENIMESANNLA